MRVRREKKTFGFIEDDNRVQLFRGRTRYSELKRATINHVISTHRECTLFTHLYGPELYGPSLDSNLHWIAIQLV